jgi:hypothetical protein
MLTMLKIDADRADAQIVKVDGSLENYYKELGCRTIEILEAQINGKTYDIICDEEGTFKEDNPISVVDRKGNPHIVGSILVCHHKNNKESGLDDTEAESLKKWHVYNATSLKTRNRIKVLMID